MAGCQGPTKATLSLSSSAGQGREKYNTTLVDWYQDGGDHSLIDCHRQNRPDIGGKNKLLPVKSGQDNKK